MENNCLVTKLKANVNDNSLLKIGEIRFTRRLNEKTASIRLNFSTYPVVIETLDGSACLTFDESMLTGLTNRLVLDSLKYFYVKNTGVVLRLNEKYNLSSIETDVFTINLDDLKYCTKLENISGPNCKGSLESIKTLPIKVLAGLKFEQSQYISSLSGLTSLSNITLYHVDNIEGDISSLSSLTGLNTIGFTSKKLIGDISSLSSLTGLTYVNLENTRVTGDISSLSGLTGLTYVNLGATSVTGDISSLSGLTGLGNLIGFFTSISGNVSSLGALTSLTLFNFPNSNVSGEIIDYVISQRNHGRSTGTTRFEVPTSVTFNGKAINKFSLISWTSTTITNETTSETVNR